MLEWTRQKIAVNPNSEVCLDSVHIPVLLTEVLTYLPEGARLIVDGTLGEAGHTLAFHSARPEASLIGIDRDPEMLERAGARILGAGAAVETHHAAFSRIPEILGSRRADFILLDLGVSMFHFRGAARGFSYTDDSLDMRLDPDLPDTAEDLINHMGEKDLQKLFSELGEERFAGRIAGAIVRKRPVRTAKDLATIILGAVPGRQRIHPATRVFQALRIRVNRELEELNFLPAIAGCLAPGGRLAVITFHSLEDRPVKHTLRALGEGFRVLTKKPVLPGDQEIEANAASRSAKLRVVEKLAENR